MFKVHESSRVKHHCYLIVDIEVHLEGFKGYGRLGLGGCNLQSTAAALNLTAVGGGHTCMSGGECTDNYSQ